MSVASTCPLGPTRRAAASVCPPAPAATSSTRLPGPTPQPSSICSVAAPSQASSVGPHRCHASAASCHCRRVVSLYLTGLNPVIAATPRTPFAILPEPLPNRLQSAAAIRRGHRGDHGALRGAVLRKVLRRPSTAPRRTP